MSIVYLLKNQHGHYLDKSDEWVAGDNSRALFRAAHKDEALNRKVEFSVKNFDLRISVFEASLNAKGDIELADEDIAAGAEGRIAATEEFRLSADSASEEEALDPPHGEADVGRETTTAESHCQNINDRDEQIEANDEAHSHLQAAR